MYSADLFMTHRYHHHIHIICQIANHLSLTDIVKSSQWLSTVHSNVFQVHSQKCTPFKTSGRSVALRQISADAVSVRL